MVYVMYPVKRCACIKTKCRTNENKYVSKFSTTHITLFQDTTVGRTACHCLLTYRVHILLLLLVSCSSWSEFERLLYPVVAFQSNKARKTLYHASSLQIDWFWAASLASTSPVSKELGSSVMFWIQMSAVTCFSELWCGLKTHSVHLCLPIQSIWAMSQVSLLCFITFCVCIIF